MTKNTDFPGNATVTLLGLPNKATTDVKSITKDSTDLMYHIKTEAGTPVGNHTSLFCQVVVTQNGEPIVHNIGGTALRVDAPLPPKPNAPAPAPAAAAKPAAPAPVAAKPPTRLEKLRMETKERAQAAAAAAKKPST